MATPSAAINPRVRYAQDGTLSKIEIECAGSNTWKAGEFGHFESGKGDPCVTGEIPAFQYLEDQATATTAGDRGWVVLLEEGTEVEIFVTNNGTDAAETAAEIGAYYDLFVASNIHYLDSNASTDDVFYVIAHGSDIETARLTTTGTPGIVRARINKVQA